MGDGGFMDVMDRRTIMGRVLAAMASGAKFESGSFTTGNTSPYTLNFQNSYDKYLVYIEMTEESKSAYVNAGEDKTRTYAFCWKYPQPIIDNGEPTNVSMLTVRYNASTKASTYNFGGISGFGSNYITIPNSNEMNSLLKGYSYNYYVVEIK